MKVKLGQQIQFKKEHKIQLAKGGTALVKVGDSARVMRKIDEETAEIVYLTGEAKGLSHKIPLEVDDNLDTDSIVKKIMNELNN
jgi:hypothetical protein